MTFFLKVPLLMSLLDFRYLLDSCGCRGYCDLRLGYR